MVVGKLGWLCISSTLFWAFLVLYSEFILNWILYGFSWIFLVIAIIIAVKGKHLNDF